MVDEP